MCQRRFAITTIFKFIRIELITILIFVAYIRIGSIICVLRYIASYGIPFIIDFRIFSRIGKGREPFFKFVICREVKIHTFKQAGSGQRIDNIPVIETHRRNIGVLYIRS